MIRRPFSSLSSDPAEVGALTGRPTGPTSKPILEPMNFSLFSSKTYGRLPAGVLVLLSCLCLAVLDLEATPAQAAPGNRPTRVLLIPLDDRPSCLQWPILLGRIADTEVVAPPREILGRFTTAGQPDKIAEWVRDQDLSTFDGAVISLDMIAFGGLVASRVPEIEAALALNRLRLVREMREENPSLLILASSVIMRLAPTADGTNEPWRISLARWAELSPRADEAATVARLEQAIPPLALERYKTARARNLEVNKLAVELVRDGLLDFLLLSQDDSKPTGVHIAERESLVHKIHRLGLEDQITVQPGTDEVSMLLLSRLLCRQVQAEPAIAAIYSSAESRVVVAPFEDAPLYRTVSLQIAAAGARETLPQEADLLFFVYASRGEEPDGAEEFAQQIENALTANRSVIVADIDTIGRIQGAHIPFAEILRKKNILPRLYGYASWNTAGNTIGMALPQGIFRLVSEVDSNGAAEDAARGEEAQVALLLQRVINDYLYHARIRPQAKSIPEESQEAFIARTIVPLAEEILGEFGNGSEIVPSFSNFDIRLPWGRLFEAEITFDLNWPQPNR